LTGIIAFNGGTSVTAGTIRLSNALALQNSTLTIGIANGIVFDSSVASNAFTLGGLAGLANTGNFALLNTSAAPIALSVGANNAATTYSGTLSGTGGSLIKIGTGTTTLTNGTSSFTGNVTVNQGTLEATTANSGANSSLGARIAGRTITVNAGATMLWSTNNIIGGGGQSAASLPNIIVNGGTFNSSRYNMIGNINLNGGLLTQAASDGGNAGAGGSYQGYQFIGTVTVSGTSPSTITTTNGKGNHLLGTGTATTIFDVADVTADANTDLTFSAPLLNGSGDYGNNSVSNLVKNGAGTMRLSVPNANSNAYSGTTKVNAGTFLAVPTAMSPLASAAVTVADGATFGAFNASAAALTIANLTVGAATGGNITLELAGNTAFAPLSVTGTLATVGTGNKINVASSVGFTNAQFPLVAYPTGGYTGSGFTLGTLPLRVIANLVDNTANHTFDLNVTGTDTIRWNGTVNGVWNINSTQNWITNTSATQTTYLQPSAPGETVTFNDLAAGNFTISIPATVNPSSVTVDNTANQLHLLRGPRSGRAAASPSPRTAPER